MGIASGTALGSAPVAPRIAQMPTIAAPGPALLSQLSPALSTRSARALFGEMPNPSG